MKTETVDASGVIERILALPDGGAAVRYKWLPEGKEAAFPGEWRGVRLKIDDLKALAHRLADAERLVGRYEAMFLRASGASFDFGRYQIARMDEGRWQIWDAKIGFPKEATFDSALAAYESLRDKGE